jgi:hypothetical protein
MKKIVTLFLMFSYLVVLVAGCASAPKQEQSNETTVDFESPNWQVVSIASEDYGIVYDDIADYRDYPLDKLVAYFLGSDGAYAEGSGDELYKRFVEAPNTVLTYIALIGDVTIRNDIPARTVLCREIASADVFWYDATDDFNAILEQYEEIYPSGRIADILACLKEEYNAAIERY